MPKLYDLQELVDKTGLPERTVRYYLAKVLEAPGGTRGRKAFYPQETLDQLTLAKQILMAPYDAKRGEVKPSLRDFQQWMQSHTAQEIKEMTEMPYRIKPKKLLAASAPPVSQPRNEAPDKFSIDLKEPVNRSNSKGEHTKTTDSAAQYLKRVMGTGSGMARGKDQDAKKTSVTQLHRPAPWQSFQFGDDLEIKTRKRLTPAQKQQLTLTGQLLQSMLEKE